MLVFLVVQNALVRVMAEKLPRAADNDVVVRWRELKMVVLAKFIRRLFRGLETG